MICPIPFSSPNHPDQFYHLCKGIGELVSSRLREGEREGGPKEGDDAKGEEGHVGGGQGGQEKSQLERDKVGISVNFEGHTCGARIPPSLAKREQSPEVQIKAFTTLD